VLELAAVALLALLFVALFRGRAGYVDVILAVVALGLIAASTPRSRALWASVPAAAARLPARPRTAWKLMAAFTGLALCLAALAGGVQGHAAGGWPGVAARLGNWHFLAAVGLYFPWALLQQFIFQFYLLGRLLTLVPYNVAVATAAVAFSMVHFPRLPVMLATAAAGIVWAATYAKHRTLWPLAVSHAVLGSALHYWVFGRDLARLWGAL
jgi:hypothetical protein